MAESVFVDKLREPAQEDLEAALGDTTPLLAEIERYLHHQYGTVLQEWKFYGKQAGWTLALAGKKRRFLHVIPRTGMFTVVITLGMRAAIACERSDLPEAVQSSIKEARQYAEGKSVRLDVTTVQDAVTVQRLVAIKMAH